MTNPPKSETYEFKEKEATMDLKWRGTWIFSAAIILASTIALIEPCEANDLSARNIVAKSNEARKLIGSEAISTMTMINARGQQRIRTMASVTKLYDDGRTEKKLIRFLAPADVKGTGFLTYDYEREDDDMWIYLPSLRRTRRIVSSEKSKSFMGSEFTYSDINIPTLDDFQYTLLREEQADGVECWVIEAHPINENIAEEHGFSKKISHISHTDHVVRKAHYYDLEGELLKKLTSRNVTLIDPELGRYRPLFMEMVNIQNGRRSTLQVEKIELNRNVSDRYFTARYLERE
jgi:outer membrane lipoprotein-sorting protein